MAERVKQVERDNQDKKIMERLSENFSDWELLVEVLELLHSDMT